MPTDVDTRKYTTSRLPSIHGYTALPVVDDTLPARLPLLTQRTGRLIQMGRQLCEIWSPNSAVHPYLPGVIPKGFNFSIPDIPSHRRYDGHLGRFDYTVVPQMFSDERPWRGFIRRPLSSQAARYPEFFLVHQIWKPLPSSSNDWPTTLPSWYLDALNSRITQLLLASNGNEWISSNRSAVWENRPVLPAHEEIDQLGTIDKFDEAVDLVLEVQRRIRDFDAWHRYIELNLNDYPEGHTEDWLRNPQSPANDEWLGAWINGAEENDVLHALHWRMPCFIAHILTDEERFRLDKNDPPGTCLIDRTDVTALDVRGNGYDSIAQRFLGGCTSYAPTQYAHPPSLCTKYRNLLASREHGWTGRWLSGVADSRQRLKLYPPPPLPPMPGQLYAPLVPAPKALPLDTVVLDEDRVPWIRPPPVMKYPAAGKTSHWIEGVVDGKDGMKEVAKSKSLQTLTWVFDRNLKRKLYFSDSLQPPNGTASDVQVFGLPLPPLLFLNKSGRQVARSTWVYYHEKPLPKDIGCPAPIPPSSRLPLLADISTFPIMKPNGGEDDDGHYVPEDDDMTYLVPNYLKLLFPSPSLVALPEHSELVPSLQPNVAGPVSMEAPASMNGSTVIKTFAKKRRKSPIGEPKPVADLLTMGLLSVADVVPTPGQDRALGAPHGRQLPSVEFISLEEPIPTKDGTLPNEDGSIMELTVVPEPSPPCSIQVRPTLPQAFPAARSPEPMERSTIVERIPSVDTVTKTASDKEPTSARDETYGGILSGEVVESIVDPTAAGEPKPLSSVSTNHANLSPAQAPALARNSERMEEPALISQLPSVERFVYIRASTLTCEPTLPEDKYKDVADVVHLPPMISLAPAWIGISDPVDGVMESVEATGASLVTKAATTQTVGAVNVETFRPAMESITARTPMKPKPSISGEFNRSDSPSLAFFSPTDQISPLYDEKSVSLGSSPKSMIDDAPEPLSPTLDTRLMTVSANHSTYLCVSPFRSSDSWRDFLTDLRTVASRQDIGIIEVLRLLEGEDVHSAWISMANESDALCIRGYYTGVTFNEVIIDVYFVDEAAYSTVACTASESWRSQEISTARIPTSNRPSNKRGRSSKPSSPHEGSPFYDSEGDFGKEGYQASSGRGSCSPQSKRFRLHFDQPSRRLHRHMASVDVEKHPQYSCRPPSLGYSKKSRTYNHPSSQLGDRSLSPGFDMKHSSSTRYCRSPSPTYSQGFSCSPVYGREFRSSGRYRSPSRYSDRSPPVQMRGHRSPTFRRYKRSPSPRSPFPSRIYRRSLSPRRYLAPAHRQESRTRGYCSSHPRRPSPPPRSPHRGSRSRRYLAPSPVHSQEIRTRGRHTSPPRHYYNSYPPPCSPHRRSPSLQRHFSPSPGQSQGSRTRDRRSPPPQRYYNPSPPPRSPRRRSPSLQRSGFVDYRPLSPYHRVHHQELRSRDNHRDTYPKFQHSVYSTPHWMSPITNMNPTLYNGPPAATYDPQTTLAFGSTAHIAPAPYQLVSSQYTSLLVPQRLSALTLQAPPIVPPFPGPSQLPSTRRPPRAAKPSIFQRTAAPLHYRIQDAPHSSRPRRRGKNRRRGKRAGVGRNVEVQDEDFSDEDWDQQDYDQSE